MNSWQTLLRLQMVQGKYLNLSPRRTDQDWLTLWAMAHGMVGEHGGQWMMPLEVRA